MYLACKELFSESAGLIASGLSLEADGFDFCAEATVKILYKGIRIVEVPISYVSRTRAEGKKIRFSDGMVIMASFLKHCIKNSIHAI